MARTFHRRQTLTPVAELNVTNLIDLGFSLLIIFMIATPLIQNERSIDVQLPVSDQSANRDPNLRYVEIVILPTGYRVDGVAVNRSQLEANLRLYAQSRTPPTISIKADRTLPYQEVVTLMDLLNRYRLNKVSLDTQLQP